MAKKIKRVRLLNWLWQLGDDFLLFLHHLSIYLSKQIQLGGRVFESGKGYIVELLMIKRGKYQGSFLNASIFFLVAVGVLSAPYISSYYPTIANSEVLSTVESPSATVADLEFENMSMSTTLSEKPRDAIIDYSIQSGDTVASIAKKFDISEDTIKWVNDLKGKNPLLKTGQTLKIPPVTGIVHTVKRGETIYSIAKKYDTDPQNIVNYPFNDYTDLENFTLAVSQSLVVPGGVMPEEVPLAPRPTAPQYLAKQSLGKFLWPASGSVSQNPVWYHMALDIANRAAPDVYAAENGTIAQSACVKGGYGCHIVVDHGGGMQTLYAHLSSMFVGVGTKVTRGEAIGKMGSTGRSTGTHLHFEVRNGGSIVNPWGYVQ